MAERELYLGPLGPYLYDDAQEIDPENQPGVVQRALLTDGRITMTQPPVADDDVTRLVDVDQRVLTPIEVVDINNPTELAQASGYYSTQRIVYQKKAGINEWVIYTWDDSVSTGSNVPYVVPAANGYWIAVAGGFSAIPLDTVGPILVQGVQVIGTRQPAVNDLTPIDPISDLPTTVAAVNATVERLNELLSRLRAHGLIET